MNDVKPINLSSMHKNTSNIFNNSMIIKTEKLILQNINYNLLLRDRLIVDRIGLYLESIKNLIISSSFESLKK